MILHLDHVSFELDRHPIVSDVSIDVDDGEIVGLLGPNGCGKSTLVRGVFRRLSPVSGHILFRGEDIRSHPIKWLSARLGVVLQSGSINFPMTVLDVVREGRTSHKGTFEADDRTDFAFINAAMAAVGVTDLANRLFGTLSGGERQRVLIAQALAGSPEMLLMDEPLNHLDLKHQHELMHILRDLGLPTLIALHDLNMAARYCDRIYLMHSGRIHAGGTPRDVMTAETISDVYQVDVRIIEDSMIGTLIHVL